MRKSGPLARAKSEPVNRANAVRPFDQNALRLMEHSSERGSFTRKRSA